MGSEVSLGPGGAFHWSTWSPLIRQHFSPVIALELMSFQWATDTAAACLLLCFMFSSLSLYFPHFLCESASDLAVCEWGKCASELNQLSSGFPPYPTWSYFRKWFLFWWGGLCTPSAVVGLYDAVKTVGQTLSAGHHEPREPESEVCDFDSTSGFMCLYVGALHICRR